MSELFKGYKVVGRCEIPAVGSDKHKSLTDAIDYWLKQDPKEFGDIVEELKIQRDHGVMVEIRPRCCSRKGMIK